MAGGGAGYWSNATGHRLRDPSPLSAKRSVTADIHITFLSLRPAGKGRVGQPRSVLPAILYFDPLNADDLAAPEP